MPSSEGILFCDIHLKVDKHFSLLANQEETGILYLNEQTKKESLRTDVLKLSKKKKAASYSPALHCSTIGASGLNFSVRNGKRWNPTAITT